MHSKFEENDYNPLAKGCKYNKMANLKIKEILAYKGYSDEKI